MTKTGPLGRLLGLNNSEHSPQLDRIQRKIERIDTRQLEILRRLDEVAKMLNTIDSAVQEMALFGQARAIAEEKDGTVHNRG